jgi:hypothetical protein
VSGKLAEEVFLEIFNAKLDQTLNQISIDQSALGYLRGAYLPLWREFGDRSGELPCYAVVDGSIMSSTFRGGVRIAVARAMAHVYRGNVLLGSFPDVDVRVGHRLRRALLYMKALEYRCLRRILEEHGDTSAAICDGALYPAIHPILVRLTEQEVEAYVEYLRAFHDLYRLAGERGLTLIGVTKDSFVNYLGVRVLADLIAGEDPEVGAEVSRVRSAKNIARRLSLIRDRLRGGRIYHSMAEALTMTSDEEVLEWCADKPGFTVPMALAPQPIYLSEEVKAGTRRWSESWIRGRLLSAGPPLRGVALALDDIYGLPPITISYWRPWHMLGVFRVDVCGWALGLNFEWDSVEGDRVLNAEAAEKFRAVAALLNTLSDEPFAVKPLADVDELVRFNRDEYKECYEPLIIKALMKTGFRALLTKREVRELVVRV